MIAGGLAHEAEDVVTEVGNATKGTRAPPGRLRVRFGAAGFHVIVAAIGYRM